MGSRSYYQDSLTWCIQKHQPIPKWQNILYICLNPIIWTISFIITIVELCCIYFIQQAESSPKWDWHRIFFDGLRVHLGFACTYNPQNNANRILFCFILFACTIYTIAVGSTILQFLTSPILSTQIESIQEITDGSYSLTGGRFEFLKISQQNEVFFF